MFSKRQHSEEDLRAAKRSRVEKPEIILSRSGTSKRSYEPENNDREAKRSKTHGDGALLGRGGTIKREHEGEEDYREAKRSRITGTEPLVGRAEISKRQHDGEGYDRDPKRSKIKRTEALLGEDEDYSMVDVADAHDICNPGKYRRRIPKYNVIGYKAGYYLVEIEYGEDTAHALVLDQDLDTQCPDYAQRFTNIFDENRTLSRKDHDHTPTQILTVAAHSPFGMCGSPPQWDSLSQDPDMSWDHVATILFSAWMLIEWSDGVRTWESLREVHYGPFDRYEIYSQLANAAKENENRFRTLSRIQHYDRHGYPGREKVFGVH
jgi:hypothetical protein